MTNEMIRARIDAIQQDWVHMPDGERLNFTVCREAFWRARLAKGRRYELICRQQALIHYSQTVRGRREAQRKAQEVKL